DGLTKTALMLLTSKWPACIPCEELAALSRAHLKAETGNAPIDDDGDKAFGERLLNSYAARVVELRVAPPRLAVALSERPVGSPLARLQAASGTMLTNLRHEPVDVPELPRRMLMLLD